MGQFVERIKEKLFDLFFAQKSKAAIREMRVAYNERYLALDREMSALTNKLLGMSLSELRLLEYELPPKVFARATEQMRRQSRLSLNHASELATPEWLNLQLALEELHKVDFCRLVGTVLTWSKQDPDGYAAVLPRAPKCDYGASFLEALHEFGKAARFEDAQANSQIRELYLGEIFEDIEKLEMPIGAINEETGHKNPTDLLFVSAIAKSLQARNIFEFGTYMGRTTYHLTLASPQAHVTTLNLPPELDPKYAPYLQVYFKGSDRADRITQIFCDSFKFDPTPYRKAMDFIFVDADHSYDAIKSDTSKAMEMLAPGGAMVWHDYAAKSPGVYKFFEEFTRDRPVFRIRNTCLIVYLDGVDVMNFKPLEMRPSMEREFWNRVRKKGKKAA